MTMKQATELIPLMNFFAENETSTPFSTGAVVKHLQ